MKQTLVAAVVVALAAALAQAGEVATVAGDWVLVLKGQRGDVTFKYHIVQEGETLTLTRENERGEKSTTTGTVTGTTVQWTITRETPDGTVTVTYKGTVSGDTMKGTLESPRGAREWSATRVAAQQP